jgi:hypothetical protein
MSIGWGQGPELWAASNYGFFKIGHSSTAYNAMFKKMAEGISLYYNVLFASEDLMAKPAGRSRIMEKASLDDVLLKVGYFLCFPSGGLLMLASMRLRLVTGRLEKKL